jgi:hypothetical protein
MIELKLRLIYGVMGKGFYREISATVLISCLPSVRVISTSKICSDDSDSSHGLAIDLWNPTDTSFHVEGSSIDKEIPPQCVVRMNVAQKEVPELLWRNLHFGAKGSIVYPFMKDRQTHPWYFDVDFDGIDIRHVPLYSFHKVNIHIRRHAQNCDAQPLEVQIVLKEETSDGRLLSEVDDKIMIAGALDINECLANTTHSFRIAFLEPGQYQIEIKGVAKDAPTSPTCEMKSTFTKTVQTALHDIV